MVDPNADGYVPFSDLKDRENDGWRIEWTDDDGPEARETGLVGLVWYAANYDDEATVVEVEADN